MNRFVVLMFAVLGGAVAPGPGCIRCNNLMVTLSCREGEFVSPVPQTKGLVCDFAQGNIILDCVTTGLLEQGDQQGFVFYMGENDVSTFDQIEDPAPSDNGTLVLDSSTVGSGKVVLCKSVVNDGMGDTHILSSNSIILKKINQDATDITSPVSATDQSISSSNSYITILECSLPQGWYPEPMFIWFKDDVPVNASNRVFPLEFDVDEGTQKGWLVIHGYNSSDVGVYKCSALWEDVTEMIAVHYNESEKDGPPDEHEWPTSPPVISKRDAEDDEGKDEQDDEHEDEGWLEDGGWHEATERGGDRMHHFMESKYKRNKTVSWYNVTDGNVDATGVNSYVNKASIETYGSFLGWYDYVELYAYAVGGEVGNVNSATRATYTWSFTGSQNGLVLLNSTCVNVTKTAAGLSGGTLTIEDYFNYEKCLYFGSDTDSAKVELTPEVMAMYGIHQIGDVGNRLGFRYSHGFNDGEFEVSIVYNKDEASEMTKTAVYQGFNIVAGFTPTPVNNTCAYYAKLVTLVPSKDFTTVPSLDGQHQILSNYNFQQNVLFNNDAVTSTSNSEWIIQMGENSEGTCEYYQTLLLNPSWGDTNLWSYIYQTVLVENLGTQVENRDGDFDVANYDLPEIFFTVGEISGNYKSITCMVNNSASNGTINWYHFDHHCHDDTYRVGDPIEGERNKCEYTTSVMFDMTRLAEPCTIYCLGKSECTTHNVSNYTIEPVYCPLPNASYTVFTIEGGPVYEKVLYKAVVTVGCEYGYQREGPDTLTCQSDGTMDGEVTCKDLNIVTCPTFDTGFGTVVCNTVSSPVSCTYMCPSNKYYSIGRTLYENKTITCNTSTAEWSHMSSANPLGTLPKCGAQDTPIAYRLNVTMDVTGSSFCIDGITDGLTTTFTSSASPGYACTKDAVCVVTNIQCSSTSTGLQLKFLVTQVDGDFTVDTIIEDFKTQVDSDIASKSMTISVASPTKRAVTVLTTDGSGSTVTSATCAAGSGTVGTICIECPAGEYETGGVCQDCPVDEYSDTAGSTSCTSCPDSTKTITTGHPSANDCTVQCNVTSESNGYRSPTIGYTVAYNTIVTTFCNDNYTVEHNVPATAHCNDTAQPACHEKCTISTVAKKISFEEDDVTIGSTFEYAQHLEYSCSNSEHEIFEIACTTAGDHMFAECPKNYIPLIAGGVTGLVVLLIALAVAVYVRNKIVSNRIPDYGTPPPLPARKVDTPPPKQPTPTLIDNVTGTIRKTIKL